MQNAFVTAITSPLLPCQLCQVLSWGKLSAARHKHAISIEFEVTIDRTSQIAKPGVVGIGPANGRHTVRALTNGRLIVVDHPSRTSGKVD